MPGLSASLPQNDWIAYAIIRADLEMPPGKLASQAGHAFSIAATRFVCGAGAAPCELRRRAAIVSDCTRVVLTGRHAGLLQQIHERAVEQGLPAALFEDSGHVLAPHFDGSAIVTALGLGPAPRSLLRPLVRRLPCVR